MRINRLQGWTAEHVKLAQQHTGLAPLWIDVSFDGTFIGVILDVSLHGNRTGSRACVVKRGRLQTPWGLYGLDGEDLVMVSPDWVFAESKNSAICTVTGVDRIPEEINALVDEDAYQAAKEAYLAW